MEGRDPLSPDEYVLRRVTAFKYDQNSSFPIPPEHFNPRDKDTDGISMFQASVFTPEQLADLNNKHGFLIAKFTVKELQDIGLTVEPTNGEGHVSISELSYANSKNDPNGVDLLKNKLAKLAAERIVLRTAPKLPR